MRRFLAIWFVMLAACTGSERVEVGVEDVISICQGSRLLMAPDTTTTLCGDSTYYQVDRTDGVRLTYRAKRDGPFHLAEVDSSGYGQPRVSRVSVGEQGPHLSRVPGGGVPLGNSGLWLNP